jgi:two-component system chemotaxis response regulator CheY
MTPLSGSSPSSSVEAGARSSRRTATAYPLPPKVPVCYSDGRLDGLRMSLLNSERSKKILVVDDSPAVREQVSAALSAVGFSVLEAENGAQALELLRNGGISLVICDVNMPEMDGLTFLDAALPSELPAGPPIVMLTSEGRADLIERAKKAGARGWLVKPVNAEHIVAVARKLTGLS